MKEEIKLSDEAKIKIYNNLTNVEETLIMNINRFQAVMDIFNELGTNTQMIEILNKTIDVRDVKSLVHSNILEFRDKMDINLENLQNLDKDISVKIGVENGK